LIFERVFGIIFDGANAPKFHSVGLFNCCSNARSCL